MTEKIRFELSDKSVDYLPEELIELIDAEPSNVAEPGKNTDLPNFHRLDYTKGHLLNDDAIKAFLKNFSLQKQADVLVTGRKRKTRLIARRVANYYALKYADIALIYTSDKVVYVIS